VFVPVVMALTMVVVVAVMVSVVVVVAALVVEEALPGRRAQRRLGGAFPIETLLRLAGGPDTEEAAQPEAPAGGGSACRADDRVGDRRRGEHLMRGGAHVAAVVDESHSSVTVPLGRRGTEQTAERLTGG
jgi:hypothetical protein